ncbi:MAG: quinolinate synthase NadA [Calditrichaeota bacterium]|nr:MAG: quinolinate synthase NadA [Calditrichota bacterium]
MTISAIQQDMRQRLDRIIPEIEIRYKAELIHEILCLKKEKDVAILGHNYMEPALFHYVPDYKGDSLELSRIASRIDAAAIIFCGVKFMAETAKILSPEKTVLLPAEVAGCSLAESITAEDVKKLKGKFPGVPVVTYVNTYAEVKAESDYCCTSGNAAAVMNAIDSEQVIFLPDEFLAGNIAKETGKEIITLSREDLQNGFSDSVTEVIGWQGRCEVHEKFTVQDIESARSQFPGVVVLTHPECPPDVVDASDFSASTSAMVKYVEDSQAPHFLLLTECSMGDNIMAANPDKEMLRMCSVRCPHMNQITLEDTVASLRNDQYVIEVPEDVRVRAAAAVQRMLEIG